MAPRTPLSLTEWPLTWNVPPENLTSNSITLSSPLTFSTEALLLRSGDDRALPWSLPSFSSIWTRTRATSLPLETSSSFQLPANDDAARAGATANSAVATSAAARVFSQGRCMRFSLCGGTAAAPADAGDVSRSRVTSDQSEYSINLSNDEANLRAACHLPRGGAYFASHANTSLCQNSLFLGLSTQWPSSGRLMNFAGTLRRWSVVNSCWPSLTGTRKSRSLWMMSIG